MPRLRLDPTSPNGVSPVTDSGKTSRQQGNGYVAKVQWIDELSDVDTSTTPPTNNQALSWNAAQGKWLPKTVSGGGGGTGIVETIVAGNNVDIDATDPANPIVSVETLTLADVSDVTASASELNTLDGITASTTELNYTDGVTSAIQTQLNGKAASSHTHNVADINATGTPGGTTYLRGDGAWATPAGGSATPVPFILVGASANAPYTTDGTADDVQINAAITALASTGGIIQLEAGEYTLADTISITASNITLRGTGFSGTTLALANGVNDHAISITGTGVISVCVEELTVDGNKGNQTAGSGIYINTPWAVTDTQHLIRNVDVIMNKVNSILVEGDTRAARFVLVRARYADEAGFKFAGSDHQFINCIADAPHKSGFVIYAYNCNFVACKAFYCGVDEDGSSGWRVEAGRNMFTGCEAQDCFMDGWRIISGSDNCTLTNCWGDSNGQGAANSGDGLSIEDSNSTMVVGGAYFDRAAPDNPFPQDYGIAISGTSDNNTIAYNVMYGNDTADHVDTSSGTNYFISAPQNVIDLDGKVSVAGDTMTGSLTVPILTVKNAAATNTTTTVEAGAGASVATVLLKTHNTSNDNDQLAMELRGDQTTPDVVASVYDASATTYHEFFKYKYLLDQLEFGVNTGLFTRGSYNTPSDENMVVLQHRDSSNNATKPTVGIVFEMDADDWDGSADKHARFYAKREDDFAGIVSLNVATWSGGALNDRMKFGATNVSAVDITVPDEAYGAGWDSSLEVPTKNAVYDKIQTLQPLDADLTTIAGLTATTDNFIVSVASAWASRTPAQVKTTLALNNVDNTSNATERAATATLTNKRITARTGTATSSATPTINTDNVDFYSLTAQAADITSMTTNLSGTPTEGQRLWIAITGTAARAITWGASFESSGNVTLPTTTVLTARLDVGFIWNSVTSKWRCVAVA